MPTKASIYSAHNAAFFSGIAITLFFIAYAFLKLDIHSAFNSILEINFIWIIPFLACHVISLFLRAIRWKYIIEPIKKASTLNLLSSTSIGFMGNMIFPLRAGELIRVYLLAKKENIPASGTFTTIIIERTFDLFLTFIILILSLIFFLPSHQPQITDNLLMVGIVAALAGLVIFIFFYLLSDSESRTNMLFIKLLNLLPKDTAIKIISIFKSFCDGAAVLRKWGHLLKISLVSLILWSSIILANYLILPMFNIDGGIGSAFILTLFITFSIIIPAAPGFIGPLHAGIVFALGLLGVAADFALGVAITYHLLSFTLIVALGMGFMSREKLTISGLREYSPSEN